MGLEQLRKLVSVQVLTQVGMVSGSSSSYLSVCCLGKLNTAISYVVFVLASVVSSFAFSVSMMAPVRQCGRAAVTRRG